MDSDSIKTSIHTTQPLRYNGEVKSYTPIYSNYIYLAILITLCLAVSTIKRAFKREKRDNLLKTIISLLLYTVTATAITITAQQNIYSSDKQIFQPFVIILPGTIVFTIIQLITAKGLTHKYTKYNRGRDLFKRNLNSYSLLSLILIIPTAIALYYPAYSDLTLVVSLVFILIYRCGVIAKLNDEINKKNFKVWHIILYLCAVETPPLFILYFIGIKSMYF